MITSEQQKWIDHLSDEKKILIVSFDPTAEEKFQKVKQRIQDVLGKDTSVEHHGATSLGISGQDEIDIYIPVSVDRFDVLIPLVTEIFGPPKSLYPLERSRFVTEEDGKHVDVFLINRDHYGYQNMIRFETYLRLHPKALGEYRRLKENGDGLSVREYYRRKTEFINLILAQTGL